MAGTTRQNAPAEAEANGASEQLSFEGGELAAMLGQAKRPRRWLILNPTEEREGKLPADAIVQRGYPQQIAGTVVGIDKISSRNGVMPVWVLDIGQGSTAPLIMFGLTAQLLRDAQRDHRIAPGDVVAAVCTGKVASKNTDPETGERLQYEDWRVVVRKGDGTVPAPGVGASADSEPF